MRNSDHDGGSGIRGVVVDEPARVEVSRTAAPCARAGHGDLRQPRDRRRDRRRRVSGSAAGNGGVLLALRSRVSTTRAKGCHYCPRWVTGLWLSLGILHAPAGRGLQARRAGRRSRPQTAGRARHAHGTVRGPEGTSPIGGRTVEIFNTETGEKHTTTTSDTGGFTIQLPAGKYRLELPLKDGETIAKRPGVIDLGRGDIDSHVEFVLATASASTAPTVPRIASTTASARR